MGRPARRCSGCEARSEIHELEAEQAIPGSVTRRGVLQSAPATAAMGAASRNGSPTSLNAPEDVYLNLG